MKVVDFKESKAKKDGEITVKSLIEHLLFAIENGKVESVVYVARSKASINLRNEALRLIDCD